MKVWTLLDLYPRFNSSLEFVPNISKLYRTSFSIPVCLWLPLPLILVSYYMLLLIAVVITWTIVTFIADYYLLSPVVLGYHSSLPNMIITHDPWLLETNNVLKGSGTDRPAKSQRRSMTKSTQIQSRRFTGQHKEYLHPACQERLHMTGFNLEATQKYSKNV